MFVNLPLCWLVSKLLLSALTNIYKRTQKHALIFRF